MKYQNLNGTESTELTTARKIWGKKVNFNNDAPWIKSLQNEYCSNLIQDNNCSITTAML